MYCCTFLRLSSQRRRAVAVAGLLVCLLDAFANATPTVVARLLRTYAHCSAVAFVASQSCDSRTPAAHSAALFRPLWFGSPGHAHARLCILNAAQCLSHQRCEQTNSPPAFLSCLNLCSSARTPCAMPCTRRSRCATHRRSATTSSVRVGSPMQHTINRRCNIQ